MLRTKSIELEGAARLSLKYRPGTSDLRTIREVFSTEPYRISQYHWMSRRYFVEEAYGRILAHGAVPLIIDAGANIGASALYLNWRYPEAHILAIEPEAETFGLLRKNTALFPNIECIHGAVASRSGLANVFDPGRSTDAYRAVVGGSAEGDHIGQVEAYSIADLVCRFPGEKPLFLKVDIEGGEYDLFSGSPSWVDDFPVIAIELHDWMLPGISASASFLTAVTRFRRDFIVHPATDIVFSLKNE